MGNDIIGTIPFNVSGDGVVEESEITEEIWYWVRTLHHNGTKVDQIPIVIQEKVPGAFITVKTVLEILR